MTEGTKGRMPAKVALGLAVLWSVFTVAAVVLALGWEATGWRQALRFVWPVGGVLAAAFYWARYFRARRSGSPPRTSGA
ncbi:MULTISPECIES: hypothetical protein [unclassified Amycolatopsis]|uniref:hypothetical protein n=1 Tax=unclassified Amycolatopsis TaxID=2618356 RepID=UPI002875D189|nr:MULTISPECIES: hypothetical protein [unclassified Amycolatopsis]MDS0138011.1 hypothetical protein [Amycolatopsis sp. 505]MDS0144076.1 hypothetical protein [Amycolatopsis sp. CM201R]